MTGAALLKSIVIGVVGGKKAGKTTTIEVLTRELTKRGYKIAVAKHIPEPDFTIDTEGKDTWRFAQSGAKTVVAASAKEIATIEKTGREFSLKDIIQRCIGNDMIFLEGFRELLAKDRHLPKIVVASSARDIREAREKFMPILVFTGPYSPKQSDPEAPYIDLIGHAKEIADLVERVAGKNG